MKRDSSVLHHFEGGSRFVLSTESRRMREVAPRVWTPQRSSVRSGPPGLCLLSPPLRTLFLFPPHSGTVDNLMRVKMRHSRNQTAIKQKKRKKKSHLVISILKRRERESSKKLCDMSTYETALMKCGQRWLRCKPRDRLPV